MSKKFTPEQYIPKATEADKIVDIAVDLIDSVPSSTKGSGLQTAQFYVPAHDDFSGKVPTLRLSVPAEEVSDKYKWRAELTFGNQDSKVSSHVLVTRDGEVRLSDYTKSHEEQVLSQEQAANFRQYLEDISDSLVLDAPVGRE